MRSTTILWLLLLFIQVVLHLNLLIILLLIGKIIHLLRINLTLHSMTITSKLDHTIHYLIPYLQLYSHLVYSSLEIFNLFIAPIVPFVSNHIHLTHNRSTLYYTIHTTIFIQKYSSSIQLYSYIPIIVPALSIYLYTS